MLQAQLSLAQNQLCEINAGSSGCPGDFFRREWTHICPKGGAVLDNSREAYLLFKMHIKNVHY